MDYNKGTGLNTSGSKGSFCSCSKQVKALTLHNDLFWKCHVLDTYHWQFVSSTGILVTRALHKIKPVALHQTQ